MTGGPDVNIGQYSIAGVKLRNDDSYGAVVPIGRQLLTKGIAIAIADGMSSSEAAKQASECCVRTFLEDYYATHETWSVKQSVSTVLRSTNAWLHAQGLKQTHAEHGLVTTFSGMVLKAATIHIFHAGDSRIWRMRGSSIEQLTTDHRIRLPRGQDYLSRGFGLNPALEVDYRVDTVIRGDVFILTTDGVHDTLNSREIASLLATAHADIDTRAKLIVDAALERGAQDNLTCQIVEVVDPGNADASGFQIAAQRLPFPKLLNPGDRLDGYIIQRSLHESNRSQVYLVRQETSGALVAVKTPSPNFEDDDSYITSFAREEWIGKLVASPNILKSLDPPGPRTSLYHVSEYFEGKTLQQWMLDHPKPPLETVRTIVGQVASGLRAMHRKSVLHLDLKPGNIMINQAGVVKLIDFGSSRLEDSGASKTHGGTVDYSAPELLTGSPPSNFADIFSLAVIAYEMLTSKLPYGRGFKSVADTRKLNYAPANTWRDDVPIWMDAALQHALNKNPEKRTEALSAFTSNLQKPNPELGYERFKPLIESNPLRFWQGLSFVLFLLCIVLAWHMRSN